mmetsp:Transcript_34220/g.63295  ORF Transcript_34220/g.63295 Transcript_34220/m.63295 type:complete len:102 (-) Transcript_34220:189-494(-)|eukprot:CAMPEP_0197448952 /NCGR_PEP_ID=MMETSP1175-20131217/19710_1 /TAXON_ID=1003142 /ORGANISM="Triceratium dubium, Strain CCMP147" /LENGTH=101 /DNA_ID=CAMNT_0042980909 /DNA_START=165 /DNA_END=470 /DNA_ORIENTATION=+
MTNPKESLECVGSLVVNTSDVKELSGSSQWGAESLQTKATNALKDELKRDECIGTLLIHKSDLQELCNAPESASLTRRITDHINNLQEPTPEEFEAIMSSV